MSKPTGHEILISAFLATSEFVGPTWTDDVLSVWGRLPPSSIYITWWYKTSGRVIFFINHVWTNTLAPLEYSERQQNTQSYNTIVRLGAVLSPQDQGWCVTRALKCISEAVMADCRQGMVWRNSMSHLWRHTWSLDWKLERITFESCMSLWCRHIFYQLKLGPCTQRYFPVWFLHLIRHPNSRHIHFPRRRHLQLPFFCLTDFNGVTYTAHSVKDSSNIDLVNVVSVPWHELVDTSKGLPVKFVNVRIR